MPDRLLSPSCMLVLMLPRCPHRQLQRCWKPFKRHREEIWKKGRKPVRLEIFLLYSAVVTDFFVCWGLFLCSPVKNVKTFHISSIFGTDCKHAFLHSAKKKHSRRFFCRLYRWKNLSAHVAIVIWCSWRVRLNLGSETHCHPLLWSHWFISLKTI